MKELETGLRSVWILEDDKGCQFVYEEILAAKYQLSFFSDLESFSEALASYTQDSGPDLIIADVRLPDGSLLGFFNSPNGRLLTGHPLVVVSSADDTEMLKECFDCGAWDYLTKPFGKAELLFKIERILADSGKELCPWTLETGSLTLQRGGRKTEMLTSKEFQILSILMHASNQILSREEIVERVWSSVHVSPKTLDVHLFKLRRKIAPLNVAIEFLPPHFYLLADKLGAPLTVRRSS